VDALIPRVSREHADSDSESASTDSTKEDRLVDHLHLALLVHSLDDTSADRSLDVSDDSASSSIDIALVGVEAAVADDDLVGVDATLAEHTHLLCTSDSAFHARNIVESAVNDIDHLDRATSSGSSIADTVECPLALLIRLCTFDTAIDSVVLETHRDTDDVGRGIDDLISVLDTDSRLDETDEEDRALLDVEDLADLCLELVDLTGKLDLRNDEDIDRSVRKKSDKVLEAKLVNTVDTDHLLSVAKLDCMAECMTDNNTGKVLHGRINTILDIEDDTISASCLTLADHVAISTRDVEVRTTERTITVRSRIRLARSHLISCSLRDAISKLALESNLDLSSDDKGLCIIISNFDLEAHVLRKTHSLDDLVAHLLSVSRRDVRAVIDAVDLDDVGLLLAGLSDVHTSMVDAHALAVERLTDDIEDSSITPFDNTDDAILCARTSVATASSLDTHVAELFDCAELEAELSLALAAELLEQVLAEGVDCNTAFSDDSANASTRSSDGSDLIDDTRVATTGDGHSDDGELCASSSVLVATSVVLEGAVRVSVDVDVKVDIDLCCTGDHDVEVVDDRARVGGVGVLVDVCLDVLGVVLEHGLDRVEVKGLAGGELADEALVEHVYEDAGCASVCHTSADALLLETSREGVHSSEGRATRASLEDELRSEEAQSVHEGSAVLSDEEGLGVRGETGGARDDALVVTDGRNDDDAVDPVLSDGGGGAGVLDEVVCDDNDVLGKLGVDRGVGERAAGALAEETVAVTLVIGSRGGDEGDVDVDVALLDSTDTGTVAADDHDAVEVTSRDREAEAVVGTGVDGLDSAVLEEGDEGLLSVVEGGRSKVDALHAQLLELLHDRNKNTITSTEVVVEGDSHAVVVAKLLDNLENGGTHLGLAGLGHGRTHGGKLLSFGRSGERTSIGTGLAIARDLLGDLTACSIDPVVATVNNRCFCHLVIR